MTKGAIAVVIPVRNEITTLPVLVAGLLNQTEPIDELVIVDGGSTDGTIGIERDLAGRHEIVHLVEAGDAWPGRARNLGVAATSTKWILLVDAGVEVDSNLVQNLGEALEQSPGARMIIGSYACLSTPRWRSAVIIVTKPPRSECDGHRGRIRLRAMPYRAGLLP
jgi:glycosyltransferase involved in cell wall biosynthesis